MWVSKVVTISPLDSHGKKHIFQGLFSSISFSKCLFPLQYEEDHKKNKNGISFIYPSMFFTWNTIFPHNLYPSTLCGCSH